MVTIGGQPELSSGAGSQSVKSALRVLLIIELLTEIPNGATFVQICEMLDLPKSSAHLLLRTMTERGHLTFDETTRCYRLGIRIWQAGQAHLQGFDLASLARPFLQAARDSLRETVQLSVLDGIDNVYIAKEESEQRLVLQSRVGARLPAYTTALGKVLLSGLTDEDVLSRLSNTEMHAFTPNTITQPVELLTVLSEIRVRGYSVDNGEYTLGVVCVAVPIRNHKGAIVAAISVTVPEIRADHEFQRRSVEVLTQVAANVSSTLGFPGASTSSMPRPYQPA
jgi:IclR family transcriptional regulator, KDG regulon repressor